MKKTLLKSIILCSILILSSCKTVSTSKVDKPEKIGEQVFSIVKKLQTNTKDENLTNFIQIQELRDFVNNPEIKISERYKNSITSLTKEKYYSELKENYNEIKEEAVDKDIELSKIIYLDFIYKTREKEGITFCEGTLYFKYKENTYQIESGSLLMGEKYGLLGIKKLKKK